MKCQIHLPFFLTFFREVEIDHLHLLNTPEKRNLIKSFWRLKRHKVGYRTTSKCAQATQSRRLSSPLLRSDHRLLVYFLFLDAFPLKFIVSKYLHSQRYLLSSVQISCLLYLVKLSSHDSFLISSTVTGSPTVLWLAESFLARKLSL